MKIKKLADFNEFVGKELCELLRALPDCFDVEYQNDSEGRMKLAHIDSDLVVEVEYNGWKEVTNVTPWNV